MLFYDSTIRDRMYSTATSTNVSPTGGCQYCGCTCCTQTHSIYYGGFSYTQKIDPDAPRKKRALSRSIKEIRRIRRIAHRVKSLVRHHFHELAPMARNNC